jgi:hypothetical protein
VGIDSGCFASYADVAGDVRGVAARLRDKSGAAVASSEVLPRIFRRKATAVAFSMARGDQLCPGDALGRLARFRRKYYWCLWRSGDALFELGDAMLTAPGLVASLPYLSLEAAFRRGHGMIYQALSLWVPKLCRAP